MIPALLFIRRGEYAPRIKAADRLRGVDGGALRAPLRNPDTASESLLSRYRQPLDQE
jgi:dihydrodipicolinate synthase/N-acetylneuraminate lyase